MFGFGVTSPQKPGLRTALFCATLLAAGLAAAPVTARPANLDLSLDRTSDHGVFHIRVRSATTPVPLGHIHQWTVHITDAAGHPVSGAAMAVDGGMPDHHHGLPTAPRATPAPTVGDYVINGMKFSMTGWWVLKLSVRSSEDQADTVTFNVVL